MAPPAKRRIRKGTFSCWECKNRKRRCEFPPVSGEKCFWCQRHGLSCLGQDCEPDSSCSDTNAANRLTELEQLVFRLTDERQKYQNHISRRKRIRNAATIVTTVAPTPDSLLPIAEASRKRCSELGGYLYSLLPQHELMLAINTRGKSLLQQHMNISENWPLMTPEKLCMPQQILLTARTLFCLSLCLPQIDSLDEKGGDLGLDASPAVLADRYAEAATHVTCQDSMMRSQDGLRTLLLQAYSRVYVGDVNGMQPIFNRALTYGQHLGLDEATEHADEDLWFQLVYAERFLSLGLGTSSFVKSDGFASDRLLATSSTLRRIERIHIYIAGRISARNQRMRDRRGKPVNEEDNQADLKETQDLDNQLKQAARTTPLSWWAPLSESLLNDDAMKAQIGRILAQMHHYSLLLHIHQPFLVKDDRLWNPNSPDLVRQTNYSKQIALSAAREVLTRFSHFKDTGYLPSSFIGVGQKAMASSITLLLLHIEAHRLGSNVNPIEHQRLQDLYLVDSNRQAIHDIFSGTIGKSGYGEPDGIDKLVEIEAEAMYGTPYLTWMSDREAGDEEDRTEDVKHDGTALRIPMPYHGQVCIGREDVWVRSVD